MPGHDTRIDKLPIDKTKGVPNIAILNLEIMNLLSPVIQFKLRDIGFLKRACLFFPDSMTIYAERLIFVARNPFPMP